MDPHPPLPARWSRLMSVEIAAEYLSISKATVTALDVECVRTGKRRLYDRFVLDRYVDALSEWDGDRRGYDERLPLAAMGCPDRLWRDEVYLPCPRCPVLGRCAFVRSHQISPAAADSLGSN